MGVLLDDPPMLFQSVRCGGKRSPRAGSGLKPPKLQKLEERPPSISRRERLKSPRVIREDGAAVRKDRSARVGRCGLAVGNVHLHSIHGSQGILVSRTFLLREAVLQGYDASPILHRQSA